MQRAAENPANLDNATGAGDALDFYVGTFNLPYIFSLRFNPNGNQLHVLRITNAIGPHSWLSLSPDQRTLYATAWTKPTCSVAAYRNHGSTQQLELLGSRPVRNKPGYVTGSSSHIFSVGGPTGEVFRVEHGGGIGPLVQELDFAGDQEADAPKAPDAVPHGDFGGLRHGAHGCDLGPDGRTLYVADIGRNCTWTFSVDDTGRRVLHDQRRHAAPRDDDGPRHAWPHPNGDVLYVVQEHSSIVDVFRIQRDAQGAVAALRHAQAASLLPEGENARDYWADEVRLSGTSGDAGPEYLFASTRGLESRTRGYVSAFALNQDGTLKRTAAVDIWETPTSGGIANAIEPAPWPVRLAHSDLPQHIMAMTDSESGKVFVLGFDGVKIRMVSSITLEAPAGEDDHQGLVEPATAVWVRPS
ncbi:lactonase [Metarhizium robertsii]|uniref:Muconate cycloisomerase I, MLE n=2 Tax=Metarhizium robertsii TaxID=568076 RepID=E9F641_METRA|nr:muconate cycloisomerase I, MLE [Metarhizium robertsii ARSEF 23]EFY96927.1 muconate cycloisomerase I, MLE [Metarhizium robertsii ARSEF 23]EXU99952.1 lactonase [Metarhizium robertsii]